ncbi:MAG TPA: uL13 family ribosomal protein [Candidatus Paceibacterota bacterium]
MQHIIDATNKKLGRVASDAAKLIMGKNLTSFTRNEIPEVTVTILNASKVDISQKKLRMGTYQNYSGYPGGRKVLSGSQVVSKKGYKELFRKAVYGMLPINKLRPKMIKHLIIKE